MTMSKTKLDGTLAAATKRLVELHNQITTGVRMTFDAAIEAGKILCSIRASRKGNWLNWLDDNVPFSQKTAWNYMQCYQERDQLVTVTNLSDAYALLKDKPGKRKRRDKLSPVVDEMKEKGIPESVTRSVLAAKDKTPVVAPTSTPTASANNKKHQPDKQPEGWMPPILNQSDLTDEERELLTRLGDRSPQRLKAIVRSICEGGILGCGE
jgi:hypothetical protein